MYISPIMEKKMENGMEATIHCIIQGLCETQDMAKGLGSFTFSKTGLLHRGPQDRTISTRDFPKRDP